MRPVVLWDVMGTLVHDPFYQEMPEFFGVSFETLLQSLQPGAWVEFELGERSQESFLQAFFADGRDFDRSGFIHAVRSAYRWMPGVEALIQELGETGCAMHAFSNYPVWYQMIEERLALSRFLQWSFVSCNMGLRKPDPAAYAHVLGELGVDARLCIFIDDRRSNCEAAREAGIHAIEFDGADALRESLRALGAL